MVNMRRAALVVAAMLTVSSCGERLVYEASTDPTIVDNSPLTTVASDTNLDDDPAPDADSGTNVIVWGECDTSSMSATSSGTLECGRLTVPFDYDDTSAGTFSLFLTRRLADGPSERIGSMLVHPGGPGFGGSDVAASAEWYFSAQLTDRFDIVGWDPRGTGESTPAVDCTEDYDRFFGIDSPPNDAAAKQRMIDLTQEFVDLCVENNGEMLKYISTEASARDMDSIRRALGEDSITYFGFSYGSELGATWVTMFPDTVRAAVFDGASDPNANGFDQAVAQLKGFEQQLSAFLADCAKRSTCKIYNDGDPAALFDQLVIDIDKNPIPVSSDRTPVTQGVFYTAVVQAMYSNTLWPQLETALANAVNGNGAQLLALYDDYYQRKFDGSYGNELEAFLAISCLDDPEGSTIADVDADIPKFAAAAKRLGENFGYGYACALWPYRVESRVEVTGTGAGPIVVIGTTGDAATPLASTRKAAKNLEGGVLVIVEADRHTGYGLNICVVATVDAYLISLTVPENETYCK
ncbi:MAG: alpha/beta hydrolase [Ilumatobacteraceae bacterium]